MFENIIEIFKSVMADEEAFVELIIQSLVITTVIYIFLMRFINKHKQPTEEEIKEMERLEKIIPEEQLVADLEKSTGLSLKESIEYGRMLERKYGVTSQELAKRIKIFQKRQKEKERDL